MMNKILAVKIIINLSNYLHGCVAFMVFSGMSTAAITLKANIIFAVLPLGIKKV